MCDILAAELDDYWANKDAKEEEPAEAEAAAGDEGAEGEADGEGDGEEIQE
jgi:hypothetical protein